MAHVNNVTNSAVSWFMSSRDPLNFFDRIRKKNTAIPSVKLEECFKHFDCDRDGFLNHAEFELLLKSLFKRKGIPYQLTEKQRAEFLQLLDENRDGKLDVGEFKSSWSPWVKQIVSPISALIIIDLQNDFISGSLAIERCPAGQDGRSVIPIVNDLIENVPFDVIAYSLDWHPENHISFIDNVHLRPLHSSSKVCAEEACCYDSVVFEGPPVMQQVMWPVHCVQTTWGAQLHPLLKIVPNAICIKKGTNPDIDSYSAFWDNQKLTSTELHSKLQDAGVTDVYICGLAYDVCVGSTALHALELGYRTVLIDDACRGVSLAGIDDMKKRLQDNGAIMVNSYEVADLVSAKDRRPELGLQAAMNWRSEVIDQTDQRSTCKQVS